VGGSRRMREISVCEFLFFFFVTSPRPQVATVDRFSRFMNQSAHFAQGSAFSGYWWWIFAFSPPKWKICICNNLYTV